MSDAAAFHNIRAAMKSVQTWPWLFLLLVTVPAAKAGQREMISGVVEPVLRQPYDYLFRPARDREPRMGLSTPQSGMLLSPARE